MSWGDWDTDNYTLWQIGVPTFGPPTNNFGWRAYSGTNCAATLLDGNYAANSVGRLTSPSFIVPAVNPGDRLTLRFQQWYQYGSGDTGLVQISVCAGTNWFPWETLIVAATNGTSAEWQQQVVDLTPYQGQRARLRFLHTADSDGSVGAGWYLDDVELSAFVPTPLGLGVTVTNRFAGSGARVFYMLQAPSGGHLRLTLDDLDNLGINELYIRYGALPSAGVYDYRFSTLGGADQQVFVPNAQSGPWYVMAYADSAPGTGEFTLQTEFFSGIVLLGSTPTRLGNAGFASIDIQGAGFDSSAQVSLVNGGFSLAATNVSFVSASRLVADFDLTGVPTNQYQLTVVQGTNSAALPFDVIEAIGPKLEANLIVPSQVGRNTVASLYIEYANTGDVAMPAPLFVLTGSQNAKLTIKPDQVIQDFWTCAQPRDANDTVQFVAQAHCVGLLQPGEKVRMPIHYLGLTDGGEPWNNTVQFALGCVPVGYSGGSPQTPSPIDWASLKSQVRPPSIPVDAWDALWQNFTSEAGAYWSDYQAMLRRNIEYLSRLGVGSYSPISYLSSRTSQTAPKNVGNILAFEFAQADGLHIVRFLASSTDGFTPTPGLRLSVERVFPNRITGRYQVGAFGRGWSHNWETRLEVVLKLRRHHRRPRRSHAAPSRRIPAAVGSMTPATTLRSTAIGGGAYSLREKEGLLRVFRADGKLDYVQDPNGTRITCGYSGNDLTSLTHSPSGQTLQLTYSGGRIATITDPVGRQTTFTYSGDHLDLRPATSTARWSATVTPPVRASRANTPSPKSPTPAAPTSISATMPRAGWSGMSRDGGAEAVTFSFDNAGLVTATDADGNTSKFYLDHRGLLAKVENPQGSTVRLNYDDQFNLTAITDPAGRSHAYAYDANGNLIDATDPLGGRTRFAYAGPFQRLRHAARRQGQPDPLQPRRPGQPHRHHLRQQHRRTLGLRLLRQPDRLDQPARTTPSNTSSTPTASSPPSSIRTALAPPTNTTRRGNLIAASQLHRPHHARRTTPTTASSASPTPATAGSNTPTTPPASAPP